MERFDRRDRRFLLACLAVIAIGAALTGALFRRAFPEASIEFRVNRSEARVRGEKLLNVRHQACPEDKQEPLQPGQNRDRREQFSKHDLPSPQWVHLQQVCLGEVLPEVLPEKLRPQEQRPQEKHDRDQPKGLRPSRATEGLA